MLRAVSTVCVESQTLDLLTTVRRDVFKLFRTTSTKTFATAPPNTQTVLTSPNGGRVENKTQGDEGRTRGPPPPPAPPPPPRRAWTAAAAIALTGTLGGVYLYKKLSDVDDRVTVKESEDSNKTGKEVAAIPVSSEQMPKHVQYLLVGGGTASFAAMRAIRSARPEAQVLMVSAEGSLPYMRPPLSKELWREPELTQLARDPDSLSFRQWNGKRRNLAYEPSAFYLPVERITERGGAAVARGWRVTRLWPTERRAELATVTAPQSTALVTYDQCLIATGVRPRRLEALREAREAGRSVVVRGVEDVALLAALLDEPKMRNVTIVGGGFLASELSAALAERLREAGKTVTQLVRERAPLADVLPEYLADEAAHRLTEVGVQVQLEAKVLASQLEPDGSVRLSLSSGKSMDTDLVVECVGSEPDADLAIASGLEVDSVVGGVLVNAEMQARSGVFAAGDVASFHDVSRGRRRLEHHDHAVLSGRLAGENMAAVSPPKAYSHHAMLWSDLGPHLGYEAVGEVDSSLRTVGVFSEDAVTVQAEAGAGAIDKAKERRYSQGVVFYLREHRVVGVLLWNIFNRLQVARQVLAAAEFEDLFEVAKLFTLSEQQEE